MLSNIVNLIITTSCKKHYKVGADGLCHEKTCLAQQPSIKEVNPKMKDITCGCDAYKLIMEDYL